MRHRTIYVVEFLALLVAMLWCLAYDHPRFAVVLLIALFCLRSDDDD